MRTLILSTCFLFVLATHAQTFSDAVNTAIPDDGTVIEFPIAVSGLPSVIDTSFGLETICISATHPWDSDMQFKIKSPDGTEVLLLNGVGGDGDDFNNTCLNESADYTIAWGTAPFTGSYIPMGDMGLINNGQDPNGTWKLIAYDTYAYADAGFMIEWSITFGTDPALPFLFNSSNLPILSITTTDGNIYNEPKVEAQFAIIDNGPGAVNNVDDPATYESIIMVELQGYSGPYFPKKNYDFDLVDGAGSETDASILGLPAENDFILKAEYTDGSLIKNSLAYEMARRMGRYAPRTRYCELMVDGEYMGVYNLTEKIKRDANRVDIERLDSDELSGEDLTGGYIVEINENGYPNDWYSNFDPINNATTPYLVGYKVVYPKDDSIQPEQLNYIQAYVDSFEAALHGDEFLDSLNGYRNFISVKSFIDFMLVNEFSGNYDSYGRSTFLFKDKNGELNAGPAWDYDRAFDPYSWPEGWVWEITHFYWPFPFWWSKFREDPEWRSEVYCRYNDLSADTWSPDSMILYIDSIATYLGEAADRNFEKWPELGIVNHTDQVDILKDYLQTRLAWIGEELATDAVEPPLATFDIVENADLNFTFTPFDLAADNYTWNFGDGNTSTEQIPTHIYTLAGEYTVTLEVDAFYGCIESSYQPITATLTVGNNEEQANDIRVFPNPFNAQLYIELPQGLMNATLSIHNHLGQLMLIQKIDNQQQLKLPVTHLKPGAYSLKIESNEINYSIVLVK